jgi:hypothetical protein
VPQTRGNDLSDSHYRTLVVRLVLDERCTVTRGEIADVEEDEWRPFIGRQGMAEAIDAYLRGLIEGEG